MSNKKSILVFMLALSLLFVNLPFSSNVLAQSNNTIKIAPDGELFIVRAVDGAISINNTKCPDFIINFDNIEKNDICILDVANNLEIPFKDFILRSGDDIYTKSTLTLNPDKQYILKIQHANGTYTANLIIDEQALPLDFEPYADSYQYYTPRFNYMILAFTKPLDPNFDLSNFVLTDQNNNIIPLAKVERACGCYDQLLITPSEKLAPNNTYTLSVPAGSIKSINNEVYNEDIIVEFEHVLFDFEPYEDSSYYTYQYNYILLNFTKSIKTQFDLSNFVLTDENNNIISLDHIERAYECYDILLVIPSQRLTPNKTYTLSVSAGSVKSIYNEVYDKDIIVEFECIQ